VSRRSDLANPIVEKEKVLDNSAAGARPGLIQGGSPIAEQEGFRSAVGGSSGEDTGVKVDLKKVPFEIRGASPLGKYGFQKRRKRMVFAVPPENREKIFGDIQFRER